MTGERTGEETACGRGVDLRREAMKALIEVVLANSAQEEGAAFARVRAIDRQLVQLKDSISPETLN